MRRYFITFITVFAMTLVPALTLTVSAQQGPPQQDPPQDQQQDVGQYAGRQEPPSAVGRISVLSGSVSTQRGDSGTWVADTINTPVVAGDLLSTAAHSRTEVQLDYANILRMDQTTQARVADLTQGSIQVQVGQGLIDYVVLRDGDSNDEVDTPNLAIHPLAQGVYRIQVNSPTETYVTVRQGEAQVSTPQGSTDVKQGQTITVQGSDDPQFQINGEQARDEFDHWNEQRDKYILNASSWKDTDPYYTGTQDLDAYGQWNNVPGYGNVWQPEQGPDWSPYSEGDWVWEPGYGYTWVSSEPWGWAPYHYGRWLYNDNAWGWWPGPIGFGGGWYRPIWAPAYVSFFGFGGGFGFGFGFGGGFGRLGWLPIGPCDPFLPWWGAGRGFGAVNVRNITNITNIRNVGGGVAALKAGNPSGVGSNLQRAFTDPHVREAISTVAGNKFGQGPTQIAHGAVTSAMLHNSSLVSGRLGVVPTKASLSATSRSPAASSIAKASAMPSHFAGTQTRAPSGRSFAEQAAGVRQAVRSVNPQTMAQQSKATAEQINRGASGTAERSSAGANTSANAGRASQAAQLNRATSSSQSQQSWQRFARSSPASQPSTANRQAFSAGSNGANRAVSGSERQGWQRFSSQPAPHSSLSSSSRYSSGFGASPAPGAYGGGSRSYGRPPLQMNQPMFSQRAPSNYGGYSRSSGNYNRGYSAPRYSAPRSSTPPSSGGGGHSSGGGGGHASGGGSHGGGRH